jgi:O-antigen ligase
MVFNLHRQFSNCWLEAFKRLCSYAGAAICLFAFAIVVVSYAYGLMQPVRWPSLIYCLLTLILTLLSPRWATCTVLFIFPLLPDLHVQLSYIKQPAVPYFINYPGIDVIVGYFLGLQLTRFFDKGRAESAWTLPPWPAGLFLIVVTASTIVAIDRNLSHANAAFSMIELVSNTLKFKLINKLNVYFPMVELLVYSFAVLLLTLLIPILQNDRERNDRVFKPIMLAVAVSASWGVMQALSAFGLPAYTIEYRPSNLGFGAVGFQPDIHAYGAHMLIGTIGLLGYLTQTTLSVERRWLYVLMTVCFAALILSKSRASAVLCVLAGGVFLILEIRKHPLSTRLIKWLALFAVVAVVVGITQSIAWVKEITAALENSSASLFEKANEISRYRLEIFIAAIRMFALYPIFGVGNGNFFRLSLDKELTATSWFHDKGGDNAHNYFFQTLAELGLVGVVVAAVIFIYPLLTRQKNSAIVPALWGLIAIALGNIYSHSLIVRENLFLLMIFLALLYAESNGASRSETESAQDLGASKQTQSVS